MAAAVAGLGVADIASIASSAVGAGSSLLGLFGGAPDYTPLLKEIIGLLEQMSAQLNQIIVIVTYITALLYASMTNDAMFQASQAIQSSVDMYGELASMNFPEAATSYFFSPENMIDLYDDMDALYHNLVQDNLDLSPSLLSAYQKLLNEQVGNNFGNGIKGKSVIMAYFMRIFNWQMQGYVVLSAWGNRTSTSTARHWLNLLSDRAVDEILATDKLFQSNYYTNLLSTGFININTASTVPIPAYAGGVFYLFYVKPQTGSFSINFNLLPMNNWGTSEPVLQNGAATTQSVTTTPQIVPASTNTFAYNVRCSTSNFLITSVVQNAQPSVPGIFIQLTASGGVMTGPSSNLFIPYSTLFPGASPSSVFFTSGIKATCASDQLFISGFGASGTNRTLHVYKIDLVSTTKYNLVGTWNGIDNGFENAAYYTSFKLLEVAGRVAFFYRDCCAANLIVVKPQTKEMIKMYRVADININNGWGNAPAYKRIFPVVSNGVVYVVARNSTGIYTYGMGPIPDNYVVPVNNVPTVGDLPTMNPNTFYLYDNNIYNGQAGTSDGFMVYSMNNAAFLAGFKNTGPPASTSQTLLETCMLNSKGWNCVQDDAHIASIPLMSITNPEGTPNYWGVTPYRQDPSMKGDVPLLYIATSWTSYTAVLGSPLYMLTNAGRSATIYPY